jgi:RNA polymerase sigma-70 factor (ECF subfamily)
LDEASIRRRVEEVKRGDPEAFGELFEDFHRDVLRLCERLLGSGADAEDATHETFLKARNGLGQYDTDRSFRPWLLGIASHHALDRLRRRATETRLFDYDETLSETLASPTPSPLQGELDASRRRQVLAAIDALPDRYRAPLVLRYYADLEYDAIAELLLVTKNQVATLLFRGRRRLRETLAKDVRERAR